VDELLLFERSAEGRVGVAAPRPDVPLVEPEKVIPKLLIRDDIAGFPELSEPDVARHYTRLSEWNFGVDNGFYPLGSCTMKHNPKVNEDAANMEKFRAVHPYEPESLTQGSLRIIYELEAMLAEICGMDAVTAQPAAGAHGELTGMLMMAAYFRDKGSVRHKVVIPDTAHGTNPASAALAGFKVVPVKSGAGGVLTAEDVAKVFDDDTAALMLTNPNTLGLFEHNISEIAKVVHDRGGLIYCDGANLNALMGLTRLGDMGVDVVQMNLHKTFSTPHGGGGPGSGPVGVKKELEPYLPLPRVSRKDGVYTLVHDRPRSIGRMKSFYGQFLVMVKAYSYIRRLGREGLKKVSETAILNANYIKEKLKDTYDLPFDVACMHECVFSDKRQKEYGVATLDMAKRLIDYGIHPPTIYFPLVVPGAIMVEPTETESLQSIKEFIAVMRKIAQEAAETPELVKSAPSMGRTKRVDETTAARNPVLKWEG
jgi:glycine dehydrogenase subunit 2